MEELTKYLRALVLLQIPVTEEVTNRSGVTLKLAPIFADAGFQQKEIAELLDRSQAAVAKEISRARAGKRANARNDDAEADNG